MNNFFVDDHLVDFQYDSARDKWSVVGGFYVHPLQWIEVVGHGGGLEEAARNYARLRKARIAEAEAER